MSEAIDSPLAYEILSYLLENPDAQDTLEGIVQWWMLERKIRHQTAEVKEALADLVAKGLILEHHTTDARAHYSLSPSKRAEITALVQRWPHESGR